MEHRRFDWGKNKSFNIKVLQQMKKKKTASGELTLARTLDLITKLRSFYKIYFSTYYMYINTYKHPIKVLIAWQIMATKSWMELERMLELQTIPALACKIHENNPINYENNILNPVFHLGFHKKINKKMNQKLHSSSSSIITLYKSIFYQLELGFRNQNTIRIFFSFFISLLGYNK